MSYRSKVAERLTHFYIAGIGRGQNAVPSDESEDLLEKLIDLSARRELDATAAAASIARLVAYKPHDTGILLWEVLVGVAPFPIETVNLIAKTTDVALTKRGY